MKTKDSFVAIEDIQSILYGNPGADYFNEKIITEIGKSNNLRGFVTVGNGEGEIAADSLLESSFVVSDGGADCMSKMYADHFGPHQNIIPLIASGHELMTVLKNLMKIGFHLGAGYFAELHMWTTIKAKATLLGCADTHKAIDFLLEVCRKAVEESMIHEWLEVIKDEEDFATKKGNLESFWTWATESTDNNFNNHFHYWIKTLGALSLLRKAVRNNEHDCHEQYRAAQKFLLPYLFAIGN